VTHDTGNRTRPTCVREETVPALTCLSTVLLLFFTVFPFRHRRPGPEGASTRERAMEPSDGNFAGSTNDGGGEHSQPVRVSDVPVRVKTADLEETLPSLEAAAKATHLWDAFKVVGFG